LQNHQLYKELDRFSSFSEEELGKKKQIASQRSGIKVIQQSPFQTVPFWTPMCSLLMKTSSLLLKVTTTKAEKETGC